MAQRKHTKLAIIPAKECRVCAALYRPTEPDHNLCAKCFGKLRLHAIAHQCKLAARQAHADSAAL